MPLPLRIDQMHIGAVEGGEVLVVEARPFAHEHVPGLQRLGRRLVLDNLVNALVDAHHVIDVGVFLAADLLLARHRGQLRLLLVGQLGFRQRASLAASLATRLQLPAQLGSVGQSSRTSMDEGVR